MVDVICTGIVCVDVIGKHIEDTPQKGKLNLVETLELHTGGNAANAAIALAKIGVSAGISGKVGNDTFGQILCNTFKREGVDVSGLTIETGGCTSASIVMVGSDGERTFIHCPGSNELFTESDIDLQSIYGAKAWLVTGSLILPGLDGEPTAKLLKQSQQGGVYTVLDVAWDSTGKWMETLAPCLPYLDLFIPSIEEAKMLSSKENVESIAEEFLAMGSKLVVIKLGSEGCYIRNRDESHFISAFNVQAADTTGAGDAFVAGFIAATLQNWNLQSCGIFANAVGAHCVMSMGASAGIAGFDEIISFIQKHGRGALPPLT